MYRPGVCGYLQRLEKHVGSSDSGGMVVGFIVGHLTWLLGTKFRAFKRAERTSNYKAISPATMFYFLLLFKIS